MTTPTRQRTYSQEAWDAARAAWAGGDFSPEWDEWRQLAALEAGIISPPDGTGWDDWSDEHPSQRAILIRAIRETPELLRQAIRSPGVRSWAAIIEVLLSGVAELRQDQEERDRAEEAAWAELKAVERASARGALRLVGWPPHASGAPTP